MNIVLTLNRSAPAGSDSVYLDFARHEVSRWRQRCSLYPRAFCLASALLCSPHRLTTPELFSLLYSESIEGGPEKVSNNIRGVIFHARQRCRTVGIDFYSLGGSIGYVAVDLWAEERVAA